MRITKGVLRLTLSDETAGTVDTCGVGLHELKILQGQASTRNHRVTDWFAVGFEPQIERFGLSSFPCLGAPYTNGTVSEGRVGGLLEGLPQLGRGHTHREHSRLVLIHHRVQQHFRTEKPDRTGGRGVDRRRARRGAGLVHLQTHPVVDLIVRERDVVLVDRVPGKKTH